MCLHAPPRTANISQLGPIHIHHGMRRARPRPGATLWPQTELHAHINIVIVDPSHRFTLCEVCDHFEVLLCRRSSRRVLTRNPAQGRGRWLLSYEPCRAPVEFVGHLHVICPKQHQSSRTSAASWLAVRLTAKR